MFEKITRKYLNPMIARNATEAKVLDIGAGNHSYSSYFPNRVSVDIDPKRKPDIVGDIHDLPFEDESFDFVLCTEVLEHVEDPQKAITELYRVLRPGGRCVLTTRLVFPLHDTPNDHWRFTKYRLQKLFSKWTVLELEPETETFSAIGALLQRICFQTKLRFNKPMKLLLFILAWIFDHMNWLIVKEYGDIKHEEENDHILTTGYYVLAEKPAA